MTINKDEIEVSDEEIAALALDEWNSLEIIATLNGKMGDENIPNGAHTLFAELATLLGLTISFEFSSMSIKRPKNREELEKIVRNRKYHALLEEERRLNEHLSAVKD
jgi:hypothetical protein